LRQGAHQACSNGRINVYFDSISILTFAARLGLKSTQTPAQAQSEPIAYVVVSSQAETSPRAQYGFNDRIGVEFGLVVELYSQISTISQALTLDRMDYRTVQHRPLPFTIFAM
jgi:hypothetical protein